MTLLNNYLKNESGAVTVDWVVLTAAIVGIGMAVMVAVSSGINDAAVDTNEDLRAATTNASIAGAITGVAASATDTFAQLITSNNGDVWAAIASIEAATPTGFDYTLNIDDATGYPVYSDYGTPETYSIGGNTITRADYEAAGNTYTYDLTAANGV